MAEVIPPTEPIDSVSSPDLEAPDKTVIELLPDLSDTAPGQEVAERLVCTAGPLAGREFLLAGEDLVLGRSPGNDIPLADTSVSRRHVRLRKSLRGWLAEDLGSGNGTLLNREPLAEEAVLRHGDLITLGETELRFEDRANATDPGPSSLTQLESGPFEHFEPPARERPRARLVREERVQAQASRRKQLLWAGAVLAVLLGGGLGYKLRVDALRKEAAAKELIRYQEKARLEATFQLGKNLVRDGKWKAAEVHFKEVVDADPNFPGVRDYLDLARKEIPNEALIATALQALKDGKLAQADESLRKVSPGTQLYAPLQKARQALLDKVPAHLEKARAAAAAQRWEEARDVSADLLQVKPDLTEAKVLKDRAQQALANRGKSAPPAPVRAVTRPWAPGVARYRQGDFAGAVSALEECPGHPSLCGQMALQVKSVAELAPKLQELSAPDLKRLFLLDQGLTEGQGSALGKRAGSRAAAIFYQCAVTAKAVAKWARAMECARDAVLVDPSHDQAKALLLEGRLRAKEMWERGYVTYRDVGPEEAMPIMREVMQMTPPDDEWHVKAKNLVERLSK